MTSRSAPAVVDQRGRRLDRRDPGPGRRARPARTSRPARASTSSSPSDRIRSETGFIPDREVGAVRDPVGRTGSSAPPTPPGTSTSRTRRRRSADIDYVLEHVNTLLHDPAGPRRRRGRVRRAAAAAAPGEREPTSRISREHTVVEPVPGLVLVAGGKLTTYRVMATDAVDAAVHATAMHGGRRAPASPTGCRCSAPTASRRAPTSGWRWPGRRGSTSPASTTCSAGTAGWSTSCWP